MDKVTEKNEDYFKVLYFKKNSRDRNKNTIHLLGVKLLMAVFHLQISSY